MSEPGPAEQTLDQTLAQEGEQLQLAQTLSLGPAAEKAPVLPGYQLSHRLGAGAFGEAWAGVQVSTGQKVAVKLFNRRQTVNWSMFRGEIQRLIEVAEHPNVVSLLDANLDHQPPFFVMPLMQGAMGDQPTVTPHQVAVWVEQMAQGLAYIHSKGILHGDLKPANVLLDSEGRARLADFGQSFATDAAGFRLGTLGYMPPEQVALALELNQARPDERWDLYAVGATAYRMLTGALPRLDERLRSVATTSLTDKLHHCLVMSQTDLVPVRQLNPKVDPDLAAIVECCLDPLPVFRYRNALALAADVRRYLDGMPLECRRPWSAGYLLRRLARRNPGWVLSTVVAAVLLLIVASEVWREAAVATVRADELRKQLETVSQDLTKSRQELQESRVQAALRESTRAGEALQGQRPDEAALRYGAASALLPDSPTLGQLAQGYPVTLVRYEHPRGALRELHRGPQGVMARLGPDRLGWWRDGHPLEETVLRGGIVQWDWSATGDLWLASPGGLARHVQAGQTRDFWFRPAAELTSWLPPSGRSTCLVAAPDGSRCLVGNDRGEAMLCQSRAAQPALRTQSASGDGDPEPVGERRLVAIPAHVSEGRFSRDGRRLALQTPDGVRVLVPVSRGEREGGRPPHALQIVDGPWLPGLHSPLPSPDGGRLLALDEQGHACLYVMWSPTPGGSVRGVFPSPPYAGSRRLARSRSPVQALGWRAGMALVAGEEREAWDAESGRSRAQPLNLRGRGLAFSSDGTRLAIGSGKTMRVLDSLTGEALSPPLLLRDAPSEVSFSPDGRSWACYDGDLRVYREEAVGWQRLTDSGPSWQDPVLRLERPQGALQVRGSQIYWGEEKVLGPDSDPSESSGEGSEFAPPSHADASDPVTTIDAAGSRLAVGTAAGARVYALDRSESPLRPVTPLLATDSPVRALAVSPSQDLLAVVSARGTLTLWLIPAGAPVPAPAGAGRWDSVRFDEQGTLRIRGATGSSAWKWTQASGKASVERRTGCRLDAAGRVEVLTPEQWSAL